MNDDREAYEFAHALYLARQVGREAAQMIVQAAEAGLIGIEQATEALRSIVYANRPQPELFLFPGGRQDRVCCFPIFLSGRKSTHRRVSACKST